jgi:signal transduction histidine kinase
MSLARRTDQVTESGALNAELDRLVLMLRTRSDLTLAEFYAEAVRSLASSLGVARASIWLLSADGSILRCACLYEAESGAVSAGAEIAVADTPAYFRAFREARVIDAEDAHADPRTCEFSKGYLDVLGISSMLDAQISDFSGLRGVVCCEQVGPKRRWRGSEAAFAASVGEYVGFALELNSRAELVRVADAARAEAERTSRLKSDFLRNTTHELRTPLNGVLGGAAILSEMELSADERVWVNRIRECGESLLGTVTDMLDLAEVEAGRVQVKFAGVSTREVLEEAAVRAVPPGSGRRVSIEVAPDTPPAIRTDRRHLRQILTHYLSNALKFDPDGEIRLVARPSPVARGGVRFEVVDQGPGVPEAMQEEIFGRFRQADGSINRRFGGIGLGLTIAREFAAALGGAVGVDSTPGEGACFWVDAPG